MSSSLYKHNPKLDGMVLESTSGGGKLGNAVPVRPQTTQTTQTTPSSLYKPVTANTTTQELNNILRGYASAGKSINDIARDYGVSTQEAINNLNKAGISSSQLNAMGLLSTSGGGTLGNAVPVQPQTTQTTPQSNFYNSPYKPVTNNTSKQELYDILQAYSSRRMNIDDIARDYGVSREEAINNLAKAGVTGDELKKLGLLAPMITQIPTDKPIQLTEDMTEDQVRRMLRTYSAAGKSFSDVANMYGVDPNTAMLNLAKVGISPSMLTVHFRDVPLGGANAAAVAEATKIANQVRANYDLPKSVVDKHVQLDKLTTTAKSINDVLAATGTSNLNDAVNVLADYGIAPDFLYARNLISRDE
jgi:transposase-like protein